MVEHGTKGVFAVGGAYGKLDGLRDGAAKGAAVVGVTGDDVLSGAGAHGRGWGDCRTECLHD